MKWSNFGRILGRFDRIQIVLKNVWVTLAHATLGLSSLSQATHVRVVDGSFGFVQTHLCTFGIVWSAWRGNISH